jgi:cell division protein FtsI (penicillin-binding protein 3)
VRTARNGTSVDWREALVGKNIVPDVSGMTFRDAIYLLEQSGLKVIHDGSGRVVQQSLAPGVRVKRGDRIYLRLG